jgi:hypothetical protein
MRPKAQHAADDHGGNDQDWEEGYAHRIRQAPMSLAANWKRWKEPEAGSPMLDLSRSARRLRDVPPIDLSRGHRPYVYRLGWPHGGRTSE